MSGVAVIGVRENIYYFRESVVSMLEYTKYDQLPLVLNARDVADILGISLTAAYRLFDRDDFPTIRTGMRRKLVSREAFFDWLKQQQQ